MKRILLACFVLWHMTSFSQTNTMNYVVTQELQTEETDENSINTLQPNQVKKTIMYYDGLGRPLQSVVHRGSPLGFDLIQPFSYDLFGRENIKYLPFATKQWTGGFVTNAIGNEPYKLPLQNGGYQVSEQYKFYQDESDALLVKDEYPLSYTVFEASPLNKPVQDYGAGKDWYEDADGNDHYIYHEYQVNVYDPNLISFHERIRAWQVDQNGNLSKRGNVTGFIQSGFYTSGQLTIKVTKDEVGHIVREYSDKSGRVILKKVQAVEQLSASLNTESDWAQTYYIYDDFGNLVMVLPPEATRALITDLGY